jgi:carbamoyl-phosphate synthase large subunit
MKSTGEVMGVGKTFGEAFVKSQLGAGTRLPRPSDGEGKPTGKVFLTVKDSDKPRAVEVARCLHEMGFPLVATKGTAAAIRAAGVPCESVNKVTEGRPHVVDMIKNNDIVMVINTVEERRNAIADSRAIRTSSLLARVTTFTTIAGAEAAVEGMRAMDNWTSSRSRRCTPSCKRAEHGKWPGFIIGASSHYRTAGRQRSAVSLCTESRWPPSPSPFAARRSSRPNCTA